MARRGEIEVTAKTENAQKGFNSLKGSATELASKLSLAQQAFGAVSGAMNSLTELSFESADFWSQFGNGARENMEIMMVASDGMIRGQELLRASNILTRNGLNISTESMENMSKAAVELGRQTQQSSDSILRMLTDALSTGRVSTLNKFGFNLETTGTKGEKAAAVMDVLAKKFGDVTVKAGDAAEVAAKLKNELEVETLVAVRGADTISQNIEKSKNWIKELTLNVLTLSTKSERANLRVVELIMGQNKAFKSTIDNMTIIDKLDDIRQNKWTVAQGQNEELIKIHEKRVKKVAEAAMKAQQQQIRFLRASIIKMKQQGDETVVWEAKLLDARDRLVEIKSRLKEANEEIEISTRLTRTWAETMAVVHKTGGAMSGVFEAQAAARKKAQEASRKRWNSIWKQENSAKQTIKDQIKLLEMRKTLRAESGEKVDNGVQAQIDKLKERVKLTIRERAVFDMLESAKKQNADLDKTRHTAKIDQLKKEGDARQALFDKQDVQAEKINTLNAEAKAAITESLNAEKAKLLFGASSNLDAEKKLELKRKELDLNKALMNNEIERATILKNQILAIQQQGDTIGEVSQKIKQWGEPWSQFKQITTSALQTTAKAFFMTNKELEKAGKSQGRIIKEGTFNLLRSLGEQNVAKGATNVLEAAAFAVLGAYDKAAGLATVGGLQIGAGIAMGAAGRYGLGSLGGGGAETPSAAAPTAESSSGSDRESTINRTYVFSHSFIAGDTDGALDALEREQLFKEERGA